MLGFMRLGIFRALFRSLVAFEKAFGIGVPLWNKKKQFAKKFSEGSIFPPSPFICPLVPFMTPFVVAQPFGRPLLHTFGRGKF
jgi:hypothetical protein